MSYFTKKPITIEARRMPLSIQDALDDAQAEAIVEWVNEDEHLAYPNSQGMIITTLEGNITAKWGDWVIKGIQGEFYPCKPDIFEATYDED